MNEITREKRGPGRPKAGESRAERPKRIPIGQGQKLVAPERKGYQRYWALDTEGQLDQMLAAWWDFVLDSEGRKVTSPGGNGKTHYLMEIEEQYYKEDMEKQQAMVTDALRDSVKTNGNEYVPNGHEDVLTRDKI